MGVLLPYESQDLFTTSALLTCGEAGRNLSYFPQRKLDMRAMGCRPDCWKLNASLEPRAILNGQLGSRIRKSNLDEGTTQDRPHI